MALFASRRRAADAPSGAVPAEFEAVAEALAAGHDVSTNCAVIGQELARDGSDLSGALHGLRLTFAALGLGDPTFAAVEAMSLAWSEETLAYLSQLSCEDPLTGLASQAHLRACVTAVYRDAEQDDSTPALTHAFVVTELPLLGNSSDHFSRALWLVEAADQVRRVFPGGDTIGTVGATRLVVLTSRTAGLGRSLAQARAALSVGPGAAGARVWVEGLPSTLDSAVRLLDELSRR